jgi:signal transduction histidine kinase
MAGRSLDLLAVLVAVGSILLGIASLVGGGNADLRFRVDNGLLVLDSLGRWPGAANYSGAAPGMVVARIGDRFLIDLPEWYQDENGNWFLTSSKGESVAGPFPVDSSVPDSPLPLPTVKPVRPVVEPLDGVGDELSRPDTYVTLIRPSDVDRVVGPGDSIETFDLNPGVILGPLENSAGSLWLGLVLLVGGALVLLAGRAGNSLQPLAIPIATSIAVPLILLPAVLSLSPVAIVAVAFLLPLAMVPVAARFVEQVADRPLRHLATGISLAAFVAAIAIGLWAAANGTDSTGQAARWLLTGGIVLAPGIAAARPINRAAAAGSGSVGATSSRRLVERTEILVTAITPLIALLAITTTSYEPVVLPLLIWIAVVLAAARFTLRPLARIATRASLQRDLVVAAMEAERARLAADLHDDALQDVTMLMRRLEAAGDPEGADMARTVADRLRTISGDLRLPILDDLGVGPALDWLVTRVERMTGGDVRLDVADGRRPPPDVELAVFRVAQEALANAVKHGRPPIVVRYRASEFGVSLSVDDAGPGIDAATPEAAPGSGHFGLLNMQQRAEQIGAILDVRRWPTGGTHVALEWRPR